MNILKENAVVCLQALLAFVVFNNNVKTSPIDVEDQLKNVIPDYAVPQVKHTPEHDIYILIIIVGETPNQANARPCMLNAVCKSTLKNVNLHVV